MKTIVSILLGLVIFYLIFFQLDPAIVSWIISKVPVSAGEWLGLIEVIVWIIVILFTGGLGIWLSITIPFY